MKITIRNLSGDTPTETCELPDNFEQVLLTLLRGAHAVGFRRGVVVGAISTLIGAVAFYLFSGG
jgi:hypothetical protein